MSLSRLIPVFSTSAPLSAGTSSRSSVILDRIGMGASKICAIHCLTLPWLMLAMPFLADSIVADRMAERWFVGISVLMAAACTFGGCRIHRKWWLFGLITVGAAALIGSHATAPTLCCAKEASLPHQLAAAFGGGILATTHLLNLRPRKLTPSSSACCDNTACSHN